MISHDDHNATPLQEKDVLPRRSIIMVSLVACVAGIVAVAISGWILRDWQPAAFLEAKEPMAALRVVPEEIGIVDQRLMGRYSVSRSIKAEQRQRLESYGWVDRERGVVHIPIQEAMRLIAEQSARAERGSP